MASVAGEVDSIHSVIRHHSGQLTSVVGQLRSMAEELKKFQADRYNDRIERLNDKEELKSLILGLNNCSGGGGKPGFDSVISSPTTGYRFVGGSLKRGAIDGWEGPRVVTAPLLPTISGSPSIDR